MGTVKIAEILAMANYVQNCSERTLGGILFEKLKRSNKKFIGSQNVSLVLIV
jgi:hypothetical protein